MLFAPASARPRRLIGAALSVLTVGALAVGPEAVATTSRWPVPDCPTVSGAGNLTFSPDAGETLTPTTEQPVVRSTGSVVPLSRPGTLLGMVDTGFSVSRDAGCSWQPLADVTGLTQYELDVAARDVAYAHAKNYQPIYRVTPGGVRELQGPVDGDGVVGFWAHPHRDRVIRAVDGGGAVYESKDAGATWSELGELPGSQWVYDAAFSTDGTRIVVGTAGEGAWVSRDSGATWTQSSGLADTNVFEVAFGKSPQVVWSQEFHLAESGNVARKVSLSTDGGRTFTQQLDGLQIRLTNGALVVPDPRDADVAWIQFGTHFAGYGTDLYRYDAGTGEVITHHHPVHGINSISFHPTDPQLLYLGITRTA